MLWWFPIEQQSLNVWTMADVFSRMDPYQSNLWNMLVLHCFAFWQCGLSLSNKPYLQPSNRKVGGIHELNFHFHRSLVGGAGGWTYGFSGPLVCRKITTFHEVSWWLLMKSWFPRHFFSHCRDLEGNSMEWSDLRGGLGVRARCRWRVIRVARGSWKRPSRLSWFLVRTILLICRWEMICQQIVPLLYCRTTDKYWQQTLDLFHVLPVSSCKCVRCLQSDSHDS